MSKNKTTEAVETTPAPVNFQTTDLSVADPNLFERFENADESQLQEAQAAAYLEFEEGEVHNLKFLGIEPMTFNEGKENEETKDVALFLTRDDEEVYNGNKYLVNLLKKVPTPNFVRIVCTGEEKLKSGAGKFKTFKLYAAYMSK